MGKGFVCAAGKKLLLGALLSVSLIFPPRAESAGLTIITHGYSGDITGWITAMADEIPTYFHSRYPGLSTNITIYSIILTTDGTNYYYQWERDTNSPPLTSDTGEIVIKLDWSQMAGGGLAPYDISTSNVAWAASYVLLQTNAISDLNGHALAEFPIHLIGHSRGGSLISEISRILGTNGIWVDHLTTLDPHPLNNDGNSDPVSVTDAPVRTYINVLFHDNYWQDLGDGTFVPDGEAVSGAYTRQLYSLSGGYPHAWYDFFNSYEYHSNVHLWYYGSMNLNVPTSYDDDGQTVSITSSMRTSWWVAYENSGARAAFLYSLIGGGDRTSVDRPLGLPSDPEIRDGYNQSWDLGGGTNANRVALPSNDGMWPNLIKFNVTGTNWIVAGDPIDTTFYYQYGGQTNLMLSVYLDRDLNPFDTNSALVFQGPLPNTGTQNVYSQNVGLATTNIPPGIYAVYGKIQAGSHIRYLYTPELVEIISAAQPVLEISKLNSAQYIVNVTGVSNQVITLQSSTDLQTWTPLATNTLASGPWIYTNNVPPSAGAQFYRALLRQ